MPNYDTWIKQGEVMSDNLHDFRIGLTQESIDHLTKLRKWTAFLSILAFIGLGVLILIGFSFPLIFKFLGRDTPTTSMFPTMLFGFLYVLISTIYFFPILFLYQFSRWAKRSLTSLDPNALAIALKYLKDHYSYMGILAVILIALYAVGLLIVVLVTLIR